jgi:hypothetical protein
MWKLKGQGDFRYSGGWIYQLPEAKQFLYRGLGGESCFPFLNPQKY